MTLARGCVGLNALFALASGLAEDREGLDGSAGSTRSNEEHFPADPTRNRDDKGFVGKLGLPL